MTDREALMLQLPIAIDEVDVMGHQGEKGDSLAGFDTYAIEHIKQVLMDEMAEQLHETVIARIRKEHHDNYQTLKAKLDAQHQAAMDDLAEQRQRFHGLVNELTQLRATLVAEAQAQLPEVIIGVTRRLLGQAIEAGDYQIDPIIQDALKELPPRGRIVVRLNDADFEESELVRKGATQGASATIHFVNDPSVPRGGCIVESEEGRVDATLETGLQHIQENLKNAQEAP